MNEKSKMPELLAPAGNFEKLRSACYFGADAVYLSGKEFGMRAAAGNFAHDELCQAASFVHGLGKKVFITLNTMPRNNEIKLLEEYLEFLGDVKPDALIVADFGVFSLCKKRIPQIPIHISTQAANVNFLSCGAWYDLGAKRVVLARELSLEEIIEIKLKAPKELEIEAFIHGAMCVSFSGRCLLSEYYTGRDANRGECTQPCRWIYHFAEEKRPDDFLSCEIHPEGSYIFGSKDLCMIEHIPDLVASGLDSLKIEGRMKSSYYTAVVTNAYRIALDEYQNFGKVATPVSLLQKELNSVSHRQYSTGFYYHPISSESNLADNAGYIGEKSFLCTVESYDPKEKIAVCRQKNKFGIGSVCEIITPGKTGRVFAVERMMDLDGNPIDACAHPQMLFQISLDFEAHPGDLIRGSANV